MKYRIAVLAEVEFGEGLQLSPKTRERVLKNLQKDLIWCLNHESGDVTCNLGNSEMPGPRRWQIAGIQFKAGTR